MSLRLKLLLPLLMAALCITGYLVLVWMPNAIQRAVAEHEITVQRDINILAAALVTPLLQNDLANLHDSLDAQLSGNPTWVALKLLDQQGRQLYPLTSVTSIAVTPNLRVTTAPVGFLDTQLGELTLHYDLSRPLEDIKQVHRSLALAIVAVMLASLILAGALIHWYITRPIQSLSAAAKRLGSGDFAASLPATRNDEIGVLARAFSEMRDEIHAYQIEQQRSYRKALTERDQLLDSIAASAPVSLIAIDPHGRITFADGSELSRLGIDRHAVGSNVFDRLGHLPVLCADLRHALAGDSFVSTVICGEFVYEFRFSVTHDDRGAVTRVIAVVLDVTEQKQTEEKLNYLAYHDELTGLANRTLFNEHLQLAMREADRNQRQVAVIFLDLDRFKDINDTMGHEAGDTLLKQVAQRLQHCVRKVDSVARLGGDEFAMVIAAIETPEAVTRIISEILARFRLPCHVGGRELFVSPSLGVAFYPHDAATIEGLFKNADTAMYHAKEHAGGNFQFYSPQMSTWAHRRMDIEHRLRQAFERGELELHYQPQIDCQSQTMTAVEALLRWPSGMDEAIPPSQFIPIAEETGWIVPISEWVLATASRQLHIWQNQGHRGLRMAINLSLRQFRQENLEQRLLEIIGAAGVTPADIELELTEGVLAHDVTQVGHTLAALSAAGIGLAIDDFGTGYSSLSYLRRFPIDTLKIDHSFVRHITTDPDDAAVIQAIIAMARTLRLRVIAEGVETVEQLEFLNGLQCNAIQGFLLSPPLPAEGITRILRQEAALPHLGTCLRSR